MLRVAALALLIPLVASYDLAVGLNSYGRKIFEEDRRASPAIWRQKENVTVTAPDNEVIAKVLVIDMRPEKDGDAKIVDGGEKQKSVTIELKSPTALRGYDFHIEVYAAPAEDSTATGSTDTTSEVTDLPTESTPTVKCATEGTVKAEETGQTESTDTIREARNSAIENDNESNNTDINTDDQSDATNMEAITEGDLTTLSDISTTDMPDAQSTISNVPDFPLTGMEGDESRHVRKIGDDLFTSTVDTLYLTPDVESTIAPNAFNEYDTSTISDISTTQQSDDAFTVPPNTSNGKDIPDFDDLLSTDGEESRFVRHVSGEIDTTTSSDVSTTESVEATTVVADNYNDLENETRNSREAVLDSTNATETTEMPQANDDGNQVPPILPNLGNGDYNLNPSIVGTDEEQNVAESSGDFTTEVYDETMPPDSVTTPVTSYSFTDEQQRVGRGIAEENYSPMSDNENIPSDPVFIDPAVLSNPNATDDYVYVPILAVISKQSYPAFRGALDNISMNVAFPNNNLGTNTGVEQQIGFEMPNSDTDNKPIVSLT